MLHSVALVRTEVSEAYIATIIRVSRIDKLGTTTVVTSNRRPLSVIIVAIFPSESLVLTRNHCVAVDEVEEYKILIKIFEANCESESKIGMLEIVCGEGGYSLLHSLPGSVRMNI
jgi:hypothetical protein